MPIDNDPINDDYQEACRLFGIIDDLSQQGVLGPKIVASPCYWSWRVYEPERLPEYLQHLYRAYGEIRWYWQ